MTDLTSIFIDTRDKFFCSNSSSCGLYTTTVICNNYRVRKRRKEIVHSFDLRLDTFLTFSKFDFLLWPLSFRLIIFHKHKISYRHFSFFRSKIQSIDDKIIFFSLSHLFADRKKTSLKHATNPIVISQCKKDQILIIFLCYLINFTTAGNNFWHDYIWMQQCEVAFTFQGKW